MNPVKGFWSILKEKGKFTTILGVVIIIAAVAKPLVEHNNNVEFSEGYLFQTVYFMLAGIILIILPSKIKISKDGIEIDD